ncbi:hypothetical protein R3P38DRAFT_2495844 [Favolaschia claudopus]|uniref:Uncharacterized protein n=1 Tax=Favolaschia claudopus TaxID=2862362 RepID=A0AAW0E7Q5_9AGAR
MNRRAGSSRTAAAAPNSAGWSHDPGPQFYGDGAPQGNPQVRPFHVPAPPANGPIYHDPRFLGLGPPPATPKPSRSTSLQPPSFFNQDQYGRSNGRSQSLNANAYDVATPTQSSGNNHIPARPSIPPYRHTTIPEEQTQLDRLLDMMQLLRGDVASLSERLDRVEDIVSRVDIAVLHIQQHAVPSAAPDSSVAADTDREEDDEQVGPSADAVLVTTALTANENRALQSFVTQGFRRYCNVTGQRWPDPDVLRLNPVTNEVYPTPIFAANVTHTVNNQIFRAVARQAFSDLQNRDAWPEKLKRQRGLPDPTIDMPLLIKLAKESFRNLKSGWKDVQTVDASIMADTNRQNHRRMMRRQRQSKQFTKAAAAFAAFRGLDVAFLLDLIYEQYLWDEVSEPEEESGETPEAWKVRLAAAADLPTAPAALKKIKLLEIAFPAWQSAPYSKLLHDFLDFCRESPDDSATDDKSTSNTRYERVDAGRLSRRIPRIAPYNFGISSQWWNENHSTPSMKPLLKTWKKWPEPANCGLIFEHDAMGHIVGASYAAE